MNVIIGKRICDYCSVQLNPFHRTERLPGAVGGNFIKLTMRRNGESLKAELCDSCLKDIAAYIDNERWIAAGRQGCCTDCGPAVLTGLPEGACSSCLSTGHAHDPLDSCLGKD